MKLEDLKIKIFADGADPLKMIYQDHTMPFLKGFTTNPTLMRQAHVTDYEDWAQHLLEVIPDKPISFEVLADDDKEMERQARKIVSWGSNVYVKIPVVDTKGFLNMRLIDRLSSEGIKINVTAVTTMYQVVSAEHALRKGARSIISIFAGRIADTGCDPVAFMREALQVDRTVTAEYLWASMREVYNVIQAEQIGCHIITVPDAILAKLPLLGKDLGEMSLDTVKQFYDDAQKAGYSL